MAEREEKAANEATLGGIEGERTCVALTRWVWSWAECMKVVSFVVDRVNCLSRVRGCFILPMTMVP